MKLKQEADEAQLEEADLGIHVEAGFGEAAKKAVELANPPRI
jgi:hypothetical protein